MNDDLRGYKIASKISPRRIRQPSWTLVISISADLIAEELQRGMDAEAKHPRRGESLASAAISAYVSTAIQRPQRVSPEQPLFYLKSRPV